MNKKQKVRSAERLADAFQKHVAFNFKLNGLRKFNFVKFCKDWKNDCPEHHLPTDIKPVAWKEIVKRAETIVLIELNEGFQW